MVCQYYIKKEENNRNSQQLKKKLLNKETNWKLDLNNRVYKGITSRSWITETKRTLVLNKIHYLLFFFFAVH
jgi:hypothetical protein